VWAFGCEQLAPYLDELSRSSKLTRQYLSPPKAVNIQGDD